MLPSRWVSSLTRGGGMFRRVLTRGLQLFGLTPRVWRTDVAIGAEVRRRRVRSESSIRKNPPPFFNDPFEALHYARGGKPATFMCPLEQCVQLSGFNWGTNGWHPFSALLEDYAYGRAKAYRGSVLEKFYEKWHPTNAAEVLIAPAVARSELSNLPTHLALLLPWSSSTPSEIDTVVRGIIRDEGAEHGRPEISLETHGFRAHGPFHADAGALEFDRLRQVFESIAKHGFVGTSNAVHVFLIKRGDDYRFFTSGGLHRIASMKALGKTNVRARFIRLDVLDTAEVMYWPQVQAERWSPEAATGYVNHLFDFDPAAWAKERILR